MGTFLFKGIVRPLGSNLTLPGLQSKIAIYGTDQDDAEMIVKVTDSVFTAKVVSVREIENIGTFAFSYETMFQSYIYAETYVSGKEYHLELTEIENCVTGEVIKFRHSAKNIEDNRNKRPFSTAQVLVLLNKSRFTHRMLGALSAAISNPREAAFNCYIVLECVRQHFVNASDGDNKSLSWERMRNSLNIAQTYLDKIKGYADYVRHGDIRSYGPEDRDEFLERTWNVTDRFFIYLDRGLSELDKVKFPLLM